MDALTKQVRTFENTLVSVINQSGLPPVVCRLVMVNVLNELKHIEENTEDPVQEKGGESEDVTTSLHKN